MLTAALIGMAFGCWYTLLRQLIAIAIILRHIVEILEKISEHDDANN